MKPTIAQLRNYLCLAATLFCVTQTASAQVRNTAITFTVDMSPAITAGIFNPASDAINVRGTYNGWNNAQTVLVQQGTSTIYTNTVVDNTDTTGVVFYIYNINGTSYETNADFNNGAAYLPAASNASLVLPTPYYGDGGPAATNSVTFQVDMSQQINLGNFTPGGTNGLIEVRGNFQGWSGGSVLTNNPLIHRTNQFGLVTSNVYVTTLTVNNSSNSMNDYKFVENNNFEGVSTANADGGGNRFFQNSGSFTLPVVDYNDSPYAPVAQVTFNVDMTVVALTDTTFDRTSVTLNGDFNGWATPLAMTNNPASTNTNVFSATISAGEGASINYQFRYNDSAGTVYDHANGANGGNNNHFVTVPTSLNVNLPVEVFNDAQLSDYFTNATPVFFSVDMTGAVGTDGHVFNPSSDNVYVNGQFAGWYAWSAGLVPAPAGYQMIEQGLTSIYTNTIVMSPGTPVAFAYKYGMDPGAFYGGPLDDEAGANINHYRVARNLALNPYVLAKDTFGNMYSEPFFSAFNTGGADLALNNSTNAGKVFVSWLGRPGARLQYTTNIMGGPWTELPATDGNTWTNGHYSTNGFVSTTNFSLSGPKQFYRLIKR